MTLLLRSRVRDAAVEAFLEVAFLHTDTFNLKLITYAIRPFLFWFYLDDVLQFQKEPPKDLGTPKKSKIIIKKYECLDDYDVLSLPPLHNNKASKEFKLFLHHLHETNQFNIRKSMWISLHQYRMLQELRKKVGEPIKAVSEKNVDWLVEYLTMYQEEVQDSMVRVPINVLFSEFKEFKP